MKRIEQQSNFSGWTDKLSLPLLVLTISSTLIASVHPLSMAARASQQANGLAPSVVMSNGYEQGDQFIEKMCAASEALDKYSSKYRAVVYKNQPPAEETGFFAFQKPRLMRVEVYTGKNKGALAILAKDGKVHGHLGGALRFFKSAVPPDSSLVRGLNGYPMVGSDFYSLAAYLKNMIKTGDLSRVSKEPIQTSHTASPTYVVDMYKDKAGAQRLLKRIYTDPKSLLPVYWEDYTNGKLWSQSYWSDLKTNQEFPDNYFRL